VQGPVSSGIGSCEFCEFSGGGCFSLMLPLINVFGVLDSLGSPQDLIR